MFIINMLFFKLNRNNNDKLWTENGLWEKDGAKSAQSAREARVLSS